MAAPWCKALCLQGFNVITVPAGKYPFATAGASSGEIISREVKREAQVELLETVAIEKTRD